MTKMKRSEFKALVKECVRECLREVMQEQIVAPTLPMVPMQEAMMPQVINPMDDYQMRLRQELLRQQQSKGMMQQQLQRQIAQQSLQGQQMPPLAELAGLGPDTMDNPRKYNTTETGYTHPSDRLRLAAVNNTRHFDPSLDVAVNGGRGALQQQQQQRMMRFDPSLDAAANDPGISMGSVSPSMMKEIFDHTAATTLMSQAAHGHVRPSHSPDGGGGAEFAPPADRFAAIALQHNPDQLFPGAQNWGALAFAK